MTMAEPRLLANLESLPERYPQAPLPRPSESLSRGTKRLAA
jgi:hypothetical protein